MQTVFNSKTIKRLLPIIVPRATATTTCIIAFSKSNSSNRAFCERSRQPPLYGKSIPYHLISYRNASSKSSPPVSVGEINPPPSEDKDNIKSILKADDTKGKDRNECPQCKKYSQGPCGQLFTKWMDCIDANEGDESKCDDLIVPLDECLKSNKAFYDKISLYEDDNEMTQDSIGKWENFIYDLEEGGRTDQDDINCKFKPFEKDFQPEMQLRPEQNMGAAMLHQKDGIDRILLLVYVKDQDGNLLGAGSVEDLFEFHGQYVLRFRVSSDCRDVTTHGLYRNECEGESDDENGGDEDVVVYRKTERIPPS